MGSYPIPCTVYPCLLLWMVLTSCSYSDVLSTKLHLKFLELACLDNERIDLHLTLLH